MIMARKMIIPMDNSEEKEKVSDLTGKKENVAGSESSEMGVITESMSSQFSNIEDDPQFTAWKEKVDEGLKELKQISKREEIAKEALVNDYVAPSHLGDIREKIYNSFQHSKRLENEYDWATMKKKKSSSTSGFWSVQHMLEIYAECMQLCDVYLKSADDNSEDNKQITNIYTQIESNVNHISKWFSGLDSKGRLEQIGKKDEISMEQMDNMIAKINDIKYLPEEYKQSFVNPLKETKKELTDEFYKTIGKSTGGLLVGAVGMSVGLFIMFSIISYFLWSWIGWVIVAGYWFGVYSKFKHYKGYDDYFKTNAGMLKLFLAALS